MTYYFSKTLTMDFDAAIAHVVEVLKTEGFGIITEIDVAATLKKKLNVAFRPYRILGACNPGMAYEALKQEDKIGTMLPCNVVVQELAPRQIEVAAIDPLASMQAIDNPQLKETAVGVRDLLKKVVDAL
ncbi:MAG: DUF302 domain-containing protein [Dokdonella sp.]